MKTRKYNFIRNIRFVFSNIAECDRYMLLLYLWSIPAYVLSRLYGTFFSKYLIEALQLGELVPIAAVILIFVSLTLILNLGGKYTESSLKHKSYKLKAFYIQKYADKLMKMDYEKSESTEVKDQAQRTRDQIFSANYWSIQSIDAYPSLFTSALSNLLGSALYTGIISMLNPLIALFLAGITVMTCFFKRSSPFGRTGTRTPPSPLSERSAMSAKRLGILPP